MGCPTMSGKKATCMNWKNEETGIAEAWENGKVVGQVITMGDDVKGG